MNKELVSDTVMREIFFNAIAHSAIYNNLYCLIEYDEEKITFTNTHIYNKKILHAFNSNNIPHTEPNNQIWFNAIRNARLVEGSNFGLHEIHDDAIKKGYMVAISYNSTKFELSIITAENAKQKYRASRRYIIWEE